jgi:cysteine desulfurase
MTMPVYLDCAATTPLDPRVRAEMLKYFDHDFGNAGSRTHVFGQRARAAVERARNQVAAVANCARGEVIFTSGATESNNLALFGLARSPAGLERRHIISTAIEHHAVLEPLFELRRQGFDVTLIRPNGRGVVEVDAVWQALRDETSVVSVMHVNNETGAIQPIAEIAAMLSDHPAWLHVDAAQSFAREIEALRHPRIDLISISGHKVQGPKGVGALIVRRRNGARPPLMPLAFGGGQERNLRPGTIAVPLVAGFGKAVELAAAECDLRDAACRAFRHSLLAGLAALEPTINGDPDRSVPYILNVSFPGLEAEATIDAWQDLVAVSHGAACSSQSYTCSHVLGAMGLETWRQENALRFSWCAASVAPDWAALVAAAEPLRHRQSRPA